MGADIARLLTFDHGWTQSWANLVHPRGEETDRQAGAAHRAMSRKKLGTVRSVRAGQGSITHKDTALPLPTMSTDRIGMSKSRRGKMTQ